MKKLSLLLAVVVLAAAVGIGVLVNQKNMVNKDLTKVEANLEKSKTELAAANEDLKTFKAELEAAATKETTLNTSLEAAKAELETAKTELNTSLEAAKAELATAQTTLEGTKTELAATQAALKTATEEKDAAVAKSTELLGLVDSGTTEAGQLTASLDAALQEKLALETKVTELEAKVTELEGQKTEGEGQAAAAAQTSSELETAKAAAEAKVAELETAKAEIEKKVAELETAKTAAEAKVAELEAAKVELEAKLAQPAPEAPAQAEETALAPLPEPVDTSKTFLKNKDDTEQSPCTPGDFGPTCSAINNTNLLQFLKRPDVHYIDTRDHGDYMKKHLRDFEVIPFFGLIFNAEAHTNADLPQLYGGTPTEPVPVYEESDEILKALFPKDKTLFIMCQSGGRVGMLMNILKARGWDMSKVYNIGGMAQYTGAEYRDLIVDTPEMVMTTTYNMEGLTRIKP